VPPSVTPSRQCCRRSRRRWTASRRSAPATGLCWLEVAKRIVDLTACSSISRTAASASWPQTGGLLGIVGEQRVHRLVEDARGFGVESVEGVGHVGGNSSSLSAMSLILTAWSAIRELAGARVKVETGLARDAEFLDGAGDRSVARKIRETTSLSRSTSSSRSITSRERCRRRSRSARSPRPRASI